MSPRSFLLSGLFFMISIAASAIDYSGPCGENARWSFDMDTHLLSITGSGDMTDFIFSTDVPWSQHRLEIDSLYIGDQITSIGNFAFEMCTGLTGVSIGYSVTSIGNLAFMGCSSLTSVTIPDSVKSIGVNAFERCSGLTDVSIGNSVTSIGEGAFSECYGLTSVTIPNSVTSIGARAFSECYGLTSVTIPNTVTMIGDRAFSNSGLTSVCVGWKEDDKIPSLVSDEVFPYELCDLYVPAGTENFYENKEYWNSFQSINGFNYISIKDMDGHDELIKADDGMSLTLYDGINSIDITHKVKDVDVTYSRVYETTGWVPWYMPFDLALTDDLLQNFEFAKYSGAYTDEYDANNFVLRITRLYSGDVVKGNVPYFIKAKTADEVNAQTITANNVDLLTTDGNSIYALSMEKRVDIHGLYSAKTATDDDKNWYYYSAKGEYCLPDVGTKIGAFRFYITIEDRADNPYGPTASLARISIFLEDETTCIEPITSTDCINTENAMFNLGGRKISNPQKGEVFIMNGKKIISK